jgi:hypothetical protein
MNSPIALLLEVEDSKQRFLEALEPATSRKFGASNLQFALHNPYLIRRSDHFLRLDEPKTLRELPNRIAPLRCSLFRYGFSAEDLSHRKQSRAGERLPGPWHT